MAGRRAATRRGRPRISFEDMAARRAERLVNLVICLLSTRQFLTAERVRDAVPGYEPADGDPRTDEAFKRMFERDKAELRDLGIPLETGPEQHLRRRGRLPDHPAQIRAPADPRSTRPRRPRSASPLVCGSPRRSARRPATR